MRADPTESARFLLIIIEDLTVGSCHPFTAVRQLLAVKGGFVVLQRLSRPAFVKLTARIAVPLFALSASFVALSQQLTKEILVGLPHQLSAIGPWQWGFAAIFASVSLWSVGQYDVLDHRFLKTGVPAAQARLAGTVSIAIGQTTGFGVFTSALARWRMLPSLSITAALHVSAFVSVTFILAWIAITGLACLVLPAPIWAKGAGVLASIALCAGAAFLFWSPTFRLARPHCAVAQFVFLRTLSRVGLARHGYGGLHALRAVTL